MRLAHVLLKGYSLLKNDFKKGYILPIDRGYPVIYPCKVYRIMRIILFNSIDIGQV